MKGKVTRIGPSAEEYHGSWECLPVGTIIRPQHHDRGPVGELLENHRPHVVLSRNESVFVTRTKEGVALSGGGTDYVYRIDPIGPVYGPFDGGWFTHILDEAVRVDAPSWWAGPQAAKMARAYWSGAKCPRSTGECDGTWEYLVAEARIVEVVKPKDKDAATCAGKHQQAMPTRLQESNAVDGVDEIPMTIGTSPAAPVAHDWGERDGRTRKEIQDDREAMWGSGHDQSMAVTYESARMLGIRGYQHVVLTHEEERDARLVAKAFLDRIARSKPHTHTFFSGHVMSPERLGKFREGVAVRLPLIALTDTKGGARTFGNTYAIAPNASVVLRFGPGLKTFRYDDVEWITAGDFVVQSVTPTEDPYWKTPMVEITLTPFEDARVRPHAGAGTAPVDFKSLSDDPEKWRLKDAAWPAERQKFTTSQPLGELTMFASPPDRDGYADIVTTYGSVVVGTLFYGPAHDADPSRLKGAVEVRPEYRRHGIASAMYVWAERMTGMKFMPDEPHTPLAGALWSQTDRPFGTRAARSNPIGGFPEGPLEQHAADFARRAHERVGQKRKYTGDPYIVHPAAVADIVRSVPHDEAMLAAAWLHDTVEDTGVLIGEIQREFGADVAMLVGWLTDVSTPEDGDRAARMEVNRQHTAQAPPRAHTVKLADLINNSESILQHDPGFAMKYLREKWALLDVLRDGDPTLWKRAHQIVGDGLKKLGIGIEHKVADVKLTARNEAMVVRYGQGTRRVVKIGKLPPEYRQAVAAYWEQPVESVPVDLPVGVTDIPMRALTNAIMRDGYRPAEFGGDFERYHQWFMTNHGAFTPRHKSRWPVLLANEDDGVEDGTLVDGMHRLNSYYEQGDKMVHAMWIIGFAH